MTLPHHIFKTLSRQERVVAPSQQPVFGLCRYPHGHSAVNCQNFPCDKLIANH